MEVHFLRPYWFLAVIPTLWLCWQLKRISLVDSWRRVCDEHLLVHLLVEPKKNINLPLSLLMLGSLLMIIALAGPCFEKEYQPIYRAISGRVIVLDLSPSMADSLGTTRKIDRARFKLLDYLNREKEGLTGLLVYTNEAHVIAPLTEDNQTIANFVPALDPSIMPTYDDVTPIGLREARKLLKQAGIDRGDIILVTDKITDASTSIAVARSFFKEGFRTYVYNLSEGDQNLNGMRELGAAGGGKVIDLTPNNQDIDELLAITKIDHSLAAVKRTKQEEMLWVDNGRVIVFLLLPLALLAFRKGYL